MALYQHDAVSVNVGSGCVSCGGAQYIHAHPRFTEWTFGECIIHDRARQGIAVGEHLV